MQTGWEPERHTPLNPNARTLPPKVYDWTCPLTDGQRSILEAICAVLQGLMRDLARTNRVDMWVDLARMNSAT
jgi:hypothetical protein